MFMKKGLMKKMKAAEHFSGPELVKKFTGMCYDTIRYTCNFVKKL